MEKTMYKQMMPADVAAREVQSHGMTDKANKPVPSHEVSAAQMAEAESKYTVGLQRELATGEEHHLRLAADFENFKKRTAEEMDRRATARAHRAGFREVEEAMLERGVT
jgi:molecular chaperone GrpE (heat shock protein)